MTREKRGPGRAKLERARSDRGAPGANPFAKTPRPSSGRKNDGDEEPGRPARKSPSRPRPAPRGDARDQPAGSSAPAGPRPRKSASAGAAPGRRPARRRRAPGEGPAEGRTLRADAHPARARAGGGGVAPAAEEMIAAGRVTVNGAVAEVGQTVDPARDRIAVDGAAVAAPVGGAVGGAQQAAGVLTTGATRAGARRCSTSSPRSRGSPTWGASTT
jgi:hypothetical protein